MSRVLVHGIGAVSPAGWGVPALREAMKAGQPIPAKEMARPGWQMPLRVRPVPAPSPRPAFFTHPRLRRCSPIAQYLVGAALEALGPELTSAVQTKALKLGMVVCVMSGGVSYSRRFYEEVLKDPATASPLIFPETVFNAPASHLAAYLESPEISYTLVGDEGSFLQGLALAANWLVAGQIDAAIVIGAEETDWISSDALRVFDRQSVPAGGSGAIVLKSQTQSAAAVDCAELAGVTDSFSFTQRQNRATAANRMRRQLPHSSPGEILSLSRDCGDHGGIENIAWSDWTGSRLNPKRILGEAFTASAAWQCVLACDAIKNGGVPASNVSVVGTNQQAIGARFAKIPPD